MNYFLTIITVGMLLTTNVYGMKESETSPVVVPEKQTKLTVVVSPPTDAGADAKDVGQAAGASIDAGADAKKIDAKDVELYKEKAQEFVTDIAQNTVAYEHVYLGMQAVKKACEKDENDSFYYALMNEERQKSWKGDDKIFVKIYGMKFAAVVQDVACKKHNIKLAELVHGMLDGLTGSDTNAYKTYQRAVQPHMLALANEVIALLKHV